MLISVVFDSGYGHTAKLADYVTSGAKSAGAEVYSLNVREQDIDWDQLEKSDAIIFGSPTYNGLLSAKFKEFFEASTGKAWVDLKWKNKIAAGFTNSGSMHGDKMNSLMSMALFAAQHGMIWVGLDLMAGKEPDDLNRFGSWLGAMAQSDDAPADVTPPEGDLKTAEYLGKRVAETALRFSEK